MPLRIRLRKPAVLISVLATAVVIAGPTAAGPPTWPPISGEDLVMKDCPKQPGASAVILYREEETEVDKATTTVFRRLKILTDAGRKYSDIEIPFISGYTKVTGIEARVVPPQGPDRPFEGEIFERTALRRGKARLAAKTFALPNVEVGSIIDYRYKLVHSRSNLSAKRLNALITDLTHGEDRPEEGGARERNDPRTVPVGRWTVQEDLFTMHLKLSYKNTSAAILSLLGAGGRMGWSSVGIKDGKPFVTLGSAFLELYNVPAFVPEDRMIPEAVARMSVDLFFLDQEVKDGDEFWKLESLDWRKNVEEFIGRPGQLTALVQGILGDATEPTQQLKRIYAKVQSFRNLSYEKDLTEEKKKEQGIKDNRRVEDVLERRYGLRSDLTRTFVKLAAAAGFDAEVVRVTARDDKIFRKDYLSFYDQLDSEMALVRVAGTTLALDPATPFCPFGLVHWTRTNSTGMRSFADPPGFFATPSPSPDLALTKREFALTLDPQGGLAGTVRTTYTGQEALVRRLDRLAEDDATSRAALEKELGDVLPLGATAKLTGVENFDGTAPNLIVSCEVVIPGAAAAAGDKTLLRVVPLAGAGQDTFRHVARQYPVSFPFPCREIDDIVITLPESLTVEVRPEARYHPGEFAGYSLVPTDEGPGKLHVRRDLTIKKSFIPVEQYAALKAFYDRVRSIDEEQIVLAPAKK